MKSKTYFGFITALILLASCSDNIQKVVEESYPDGTPKTVYYYQNKGNQKELVKEVSFYPNKNKRLEGEYKANERNGKWTYYYENGNLWSEGSFVNGIDDGYRVTYYENGHKRYEGNFKMGNRIGIWKFYNENGENLKEEDYGEGETKPK